jgi:hypothetical protein
VSFALLCGVMVPPSLHCSVACMVNIGGLGMIKL